MADADTKVIGPFYVFAPDKVTTTSHGDKRTTTPFTSDDRKSVETTCSVNASVDMRFTHSSREASAGALTRK